MTDEEKTTNDERLTALMWDIMESRGSRKRVHKDFWPRFARKYEAMFGKPIPPNGMRKKFFRWRIKMQNDSTPDTMTFFLKPRKCLMDKVGNLVSNITSFIIRIFAWVIDWFTGIDSEAYSFIVGCLGTQEGIDELSSKKRTGENGGLINGT